MEVGENHRGGTLKNVNKIPMNGEAHYNVFQPNQSMEAPFRKVIKQLTPVKFPTSSPVMIFFPFQWHLS